MEKEDGDSSAPPDERSCEGKNEDEDRDSEFVEVDPTGRYGRYNEVLGRGAFKTVYRAFDEVDGMEVAWNQVKVQDLLQSPEDLSRLYSEVHLLKSLRHKNIIKFYNSWIDPKTNNVNFITEIFTSGTLRQYRKKHKHCDLKAVKNWARQILRGLLYLHSHDPPIIHRDLKCDNIFVNGNQGEVKIGDLGLAAILKQAHAAHSVIGTPEFMAPELYEEEYNELVDIYSFGMCVLEMVTFEYPYSECTNAAQIYKKVTAGKKPAALEKVKDAEVRAFVEKCLASASSRLPARELLMDPFLNDGDTVDLSSGIPRTQSRAEEMVGLSTIAEEHDRIAELNYNGRDENAFHREPLDARRLPSFTDSETDALMERADGDDNVTDEGSGNKRSGRDFKVKGKKRDEDDIIYLRLRIADSLGHVRNIHFPFDIRIDSAFSVASEMVTELDLSDQDVSNIAEMIDREVLELYPDWNPGVSIEEYAIPETETEILPAAIDDEVSCVAEVEEHSEASPVKDSGEEESTVNAGAPEQQENPLAMSSMGSIRSPNHNKGYSYSSDDFASGYLNHVHSLLLSPNTKVSLGATSPPNMSLDRGVTHGRFWEGFEDSADANSASSDEVNGGSFDSSGRLNMEDNGNPPLMASELEKSGSMQVQDKEDQERHSLGMNTHASAVDANSTEFKVEGSYSAEGQANSASANSPEKKLNHTKSLPLEIQKTFQSILTPVPMLKAGTVKSNGTYQHSLLAQFSMVNGCNSVADIMGDELDDSDLKRIEEELRAEKEVELQILEQKYRRKLEEAKNRHLQKRLAEAGKSQAPGFASVPVSLPVTKSDPKLIDSQPVHPVS